MPPIDHNAPDLKYLVYYRQDEPEANWHIEALTDWRQDKLIVQNLPTFTKYKIKVVAVNCRGEASIAPHEIIGYSGEA